MLNWAFPLMKMDGCEVYEIVAGTGEEESSSDGCEMSTADVANKTAARAKATVPRRLDGPRALGAGILRSMYGVLGDDAP